MSTATEPINTPNPKGVLVPEGGEPIPLSGERLSLGRGESCDICLRFPNISRVHCELEFRQGYWFITDKNSTNGVRVNGVRVFHKLLVPGDEITIARRHFTIDYTLCS